MNFPTYLNLRSFSKAPPQYPPSDIDVPSCVMNSAIKRVIIVSTDGVTSVVWLCNTAAMKDLFCTLSHEYGSVHLFAADIMGAEQAVRSGVLLAIDRPQPPPEKKKKRRNRYQNRRWPRPACGWPVCLSFRAVLPSVPTLALLCRHERLQMDFAKRVTCNVRCRH